MFARMFSRIQHPSFAHKARFSTVFALSGCSGPTMKERIVIRIRIGMSPNTSSYRMHERSGLIVGLIVGALSFCVFGVAQATTYTFTQSSWSGGQTAGTLASPAPTSTQYASATSVTTSTNLSLATTTASLGSRIDLTQNVPKLLWSAGTGYNAMVISTSGIVHVVYNSGECNGFNNLVYRDSQNWNSLVCITNATSGLTYNHLSMAVDGAGNVHLAYDSTESGATNVSYRYALASTSWQVWSAPVVVATANKSAASPSIAVDANNAVYIAYTSQEFSGTALLNVVLRSASSSSNWQSWSGRTDVTTSTTGGNVANPSVAIAPNGIIHISYGSFEASSSLSQIAYRNSNNWHNRIDITNGPVNTNYYVSQMLVDASNTAYINYINNITSFSYFVTSTNYSSWSAPVTSSQNTITNGTSAFIEGLGKIGFVYQWAAGALNYCDNWNTLCATSSVNLSNSSDRFPAAGVDASGKIHVTDQSEAFNPSLFNIAYRYSTSSGATWSARTDVSQLWGNPTASNVYSFQDSSGTVHAAYLSLDADPNHFVNNLEYINSASGTPVALTASTTSMFVPSAVGVNTVQIAGNNGSIVIAYTAKEVNPYMGVMTRYSLNNGSTWSFVAVATTSGYNYNANGIGLTRGAYSGNYYLATSRTTAIDIYKSTNNGQSWSLAGTINYSGTGNAMQVPALAEGPGNILYLVYSSKELDGVSFYPMFAYSTNGGTSWSSQVALSSADGLSHMSPSIIVDGTGKTYVVYDYNGQNRLNIYTGSGTSTPTSASFVTPTNPRLSSLAYSSGTLILSYINQTSHLLLMQQSTDGGQTWSASTTIASSTLLYIQDDGSYTPMISSTGTIGFLYDSTDLSTYSNISERFYTPSRYASLGTLKSQPYDSTDPSDVIGEVDWSETTSTGNGVTVAISSATSSAGLGTTWSNFTESTAGCTTAAVATSSVHTNQTFSNGGITYGWTELGTTFSSAQAGQITAVRFYKLAGNTGTHVGNIWDATSHVLLASTTFTGESASGWQQQNLATPLTITAGKNYVVSYNDADPNSWPSGSAAFPITNGVLTGSAGVYAASAGAFPNQSFGTTDVGADVVFSAYPSVSCSGSAIPAALKSNSRWWQYQVTETSNGVTAPAVQGVTVKYVVNSAPAFDASYGGGTGITQADNTTTTDASHVGDVTFTYRFKDIDYTTDGAANGHATGTVTPTYQYNVGSGWQTMTQFVTANATSDIVLATTSFINQTVIWNPAAEPGIGSAYATSSQIRVTLDDHQLANNTATATSSAFTIDTQPPTASLTNLNIASNTLTYSFADASGFMYRFATTSISSSTPSSSVPWTMAPAGTASGTKSLVLGAGLTAYAEVQDVYGNDIVVSNAAPQSPQNLSVSGNIISWSSYANAPGAAFASYELDRSSGGAFASIYTSTNQSSNSFTDNGAVQGQTYFYRMKVTDTDGDVSTWATGQTIVADISQGALSFAFLGNGSVKYRFANGSSSAAADGLNPTSGQWQTLSSSFATGTISWIFSSSTSPTLSYEVVDNYGNDYAFTATMPPAPTGIVVKDTSNVYTGVYSDYLSWATSTASNFLRYDIWRSTSGSYAPYATTTNPYFGDTGLMPNNIAYYYKVRVADTKGNVSAFSPQVFITPTGRGGGPSISNVATSSLDTSAIVTWNTNVDSTGFVFYAASSAQLAQGNASSAPALESGSGPYVHTANITGLVPGTTYYFYVQSVDSIGNTSVDNNNYAYYTFMATNSHPAQISSINANPSQNSAEINWVTDKPANSALFYGTASGTYPNSVAGPTSSYVTFHDLTLNNLAASTTYYFYVQSTDSGNNVATSSGQSFATLQFGPVITSTTVSGVATSTATITWATDKAADANVDYSTSLAFSPYSTIGTTTLAMNHSVTLSGLTPSTTYYLDVRSTDQYGNGTKDSNGGAYYSFTTAKDTVPPAISSIQTPAVGQSNVTITWGTDKGATSQIAYGTTTSYGASTTLDNSYTTSHSQSITGLTPTTLYYYRIHAVDQFGNESFATSTVTTLSPPGPSISGVSATTTDFTATVAWTTGSNGDSGVYFGTSTSTISGSAVSSTQTTSHALVITGLTPSTTYYYYVQSVDPYGDTTIDRNSGQYYQFTTTNSAKPVITGVSASAQSQTVATVSWTTDKLSNSQVLYGTASGIYASSTALGDTSPMTASHVASLAGLAASTTYYYVAKSVDNAGNAATSGEQTFTTLAPVAPPLVITDVTSSPSDIGATVAWDTNVDANGYVFYATTPGSFATSTGNASSVGGAAPFHHAITLGGLTPSTTYYFYVQSTDGIGDVAIDNSAGAYYSFTTTNSQSPLISNVAVPFVSGDSAAITWSTSKFTDGTILYGTSTEAYTASVATSTLAANHEIFLSDLAAETTYYYVIHVKDAAGNEATSTEQTFTTLAPVFTGVTTTYAGDTEAIIGWQTSMDSDSIVHYFVPASGGGAVMDVGTSTLVGGTAPFQHSVVIDGLAPGTTYEFYLESDDANGVPHLDNNFSHYYQFTTTDHRPPTITGVSAPITGTSTAVILWSTDRNGTSQVDYGSATGTYPSSTALDPTLGTYHAVTLSDLVPASTYHYRVRSDSSAGSEGVSGDYSFATQDTPKTQYVYSTGYVVTSAADTVPPKITDVVATTTPFDATVSFITDEPAVGFVDYGTSTDYGLAAADRAFGTVHTISAKGLVMGTTYHFYVRAIDRSGNEASTTDATFATQYLTEASLSSSTTIANAYEFQQEIENSIASALPSLVPPFLSQPVVTDVGQNSATVRWTTNIKSYSVVYYATDADFTGATSTANPYDAQSSEVNTKVATHTVTVTGLQPNTLYHAMAESFSIPGVFGKSGDVTFITAAAKVVPQVSKVTPTSFQVSWTTDGDTNSIVQYRDAKTGVTQTITDDALVTVHSVTVQNLTPASTYLVTVSGNTANGNLIAAASPVTVRTTKDTVAPVISNIRIQTIIDPQSPNVAQAIVGWMTDKPANSVVQYDQGVGGPTSTYAHTVQDLSSFVTSHVVIVPNLVPGAVYRVRVASTDQASNTAAFPPQTMIVSQQSQSILDVILNNFENTFQFMRNIQK